MRNNSSPSPSGQVLSGVIKRDGIEGMALTVRQFFDLDAVQLEPGDSQTQIGRASCRERVCQYV